MIDLLSLYHRLLGESLDGYKFTAVFLPAQPNFSKRSFPDGDELLEIFNLYSLPFELRHQRLELHQRSLNLLDLLLGEVELGHPLFNLANVLGFLLLFLEENRVFL